MLSSYRVSAADAEIGKKMSLRNTIGSANLEAENFVFTQDAIAGLCADAEDFTHLLNAHHIRIGQAFSVEVKTYKFLFPYASPRRNGVKMA